MNAPAQIAPPQVDVICADALDALDCFPSGSFDPVLCDPPYGITANKWDTMIDFKDLWPVLWRIAKSNAAIVMTASQPFSSLLVCSQIDKFKHEWVRIKNRGGNFANTIRGPMKEHESIIVFSRGKWTYNKQMQERTGSGADRVKYNVAFKTSSDNYRQFEDRPVNTLPSLRVPSSWQKFNTATDGFHPTQKPVDLFRYLIRTYSNPGDHILDFCAGSGTTGVAAQAEGRRATLIEIDPDYCAVARQRLGL